MSQDPSPPPILEYWRPAGRTDLRTIAVRQKAILYCILGYILGGVLQAVLPPPLALIFALLLVISVITGAVFVFMLSIAIYGVGAGIVLGILTLIPLVGLIVLLIVNGRATKLLRQHGIRVGLMGADTRQIPDPGQIPIP